MRSSYSEMRNARCKIQDANGNVGESFVCILHFESCITSFCLDWQIRRIIGEAERSGFGRVEKRTSSTDIRFGHADLDGAEAVDCEAVRVSQRLASLGRRNTRRLQKRADLLRVNLTAGDKHAP